MTHTSVWPEFVSVRSLKDRLNAAAGNVLGIVCFGTEADLAASQDYPVFTVPMLQCEQEPIVELWLGRDPMSYVKTRNMHYAKNEDVLFGALRYKDTVDGAVDSLAYEAYMQVLEHIATQGYPYFIRMWNHFPAINVETCGLERYRQFCRGRHQAFSENQYTFENDLPAASAVGTSGDGLTIYFLASREPGIQVENPRQLNAYRYPVQYGPRSPSFSRAILKRWNEEQQLYISGTASIVGHETRHAGDVARQTEETLRNIEVVMKNALGDGCTLATLDPKSLVKVYLRDREYFPSVKTMVEGAVGGASLLFIQGDICRADLLLEIEAVVRV